MKFADKFVAYIDILGFKNLVEDAEAGRGFSLAELIALVNLLEVPIEGFIRDRSIPSICPNAPRTLQDLDFRITRFSDCAVVSTEISPSGVMALVDHCWTVVLALLRHGIACRGTIIRGTIFHTGGHVIGSGLHKAFEGEKRVTAFRRTADERGTPFVEIDQDVCNYVADCGDPCVIKMFSRSVKSAGGMTAIFPFTRLAHRFVIQAGQPIDCLREAQANENVRRLIGQLKDQISRYGGQLAPDALKKRDHYLAALDTQLEQCANLDDFLSKVNSAPSPTGSPADAV